MVAFETIGPPFPTIAAYCCQSSILIRFAQLISDLYG